MNRNNTLISGIALLLAFPAMATAGPALDPAFQNLAAVEAFSAVCQQEEQLDDPRRGSFMEIPGAIAPPIVVGSSNTSTGGFITP